MYHQDKKQWLGVGGAFFVYNWELVFEQYMDEWSEDLYSCAAILEMRCQYALDRYLNR